MVICQDTAHTIGYIDVRIIAVTCSGVYSGQLLRFTSSIAVLVAHNSTWCVVGLCPSTSGVLLRAAPYTLAWLSALSSPDVYHVLATSIVYPLRAHLVWKHRVCP